MPLHEQIKGGYGKIEMGRKISPCPMAHLFDPTDSGQYEKDRFDEHTHAPRFWLAYFQIGRIAVLGLKAVVSQDDHLLFESPSHWLKDGIMDVGCIPIPIDGQPPLVKQ
jgi:hypothetical protein|tara:strand:+ start:203 stop:529 length:327 start_codon:yes stop_codon:yes gene_type:complete